MKKNKIRFLSILTVLVLTCCFLKPPKIVQAKDNKKYTVNYVASKEYKNKWGIKKITKTEAKMLAQIVYLEARGEGDKGELAVIEVVLNRVSS